MTHQTTMPITSLAGNGSRIKARANVTEAMFPPDQWAALLAEGAVIELDPATPKPEPEPVKKTTTRRRKSNA